MNKKSYSILAVALCAASLVQPTYADWQVPYCIPIIAGIYALQSLFSAKQRYNKLLKYQQLNYKFQDLITNFDAIDKEEKTRFVDKTSFESYLSAKYSHFPDQTNLILTTPSFKKIELKLYNDDKDMIRKLRQKITTPYNEILRKMYNLRAECGSEATKNFVVKKPKSFLGWLLS